MHKREYLSFWEGKKAELKSIMDEFGIENTKGTTDEFYKIAEIYPKIDPLLSLLNDINASTPEILSQSKFDIIKSKIAERMLSQ